MDSSSRPGWQVLGASFATLLTGTVCVHALAFVASIFVTRALGPSEFGSLAFGLSVALVVALAGGLGLDDLLVRELARRPASAWLMPSSLRTVQMVVPEAR